MRKLTQKQKWLVREIEKLKILFGLDHHKVIDEHGDSYLTERLELIRNQIIRSEVIISYTMIDEFMNTRIAQFQFGKSKSFYQLWRTKKFQLFNHHVLEELSLMAKVRFARSIKPFPKRIFADIERLNALRNGLAHAFFPENLKRSKPEWKGNSIFSLEGAKRFREDMDATNHYFYPEIPHATESSNDKKYRT